MYQYRQRLYQAYSTTHAGSQHIGNIKPRFDEEVQQFALEIIPIVKRIFPDNPQQKNLLDMGCGTGSLLYALQRAGYTAAQGIDISPEQIDIAQKMGLAKVQIANVFDFLQANPTQFDAILGMDIIEHFGKDELVDLLLLAQKALKPNGYMLFRTHNADAPFTSIYVNGDFTHENALNGLSARQLFKNCHFTSVEVLPSLLYTAGWFKNLLRKITWALVKLCIRIVLFATARTAKQSVFTPNLIILAQK